MSLGEDVLKTNWLLLRIQSGREDKIKKDIDEAIEELKKEMESKKLISERIDMEDKIVSEKLLSVEVPKIIDNVFAKDGSRKQEEKCAFPGYLFIKIHAKKSNNPDKKKIPNQKSEDYETIVIFSFLRKILGKVSIVGLKTKTNSDGLENMRVLTQTEYDKMMAKTKEISEKRKNSKEIYLGSFVKIINGPFSSTEAKVIQADYDKGYVKVSFNLFGQEMFEECRLEDVKIISVDE